MLTSSVPPGDSTASRLHERLHSKGVRTFVFAGVATSASLEGTPRLASDLGDRVVVVEDACSAATPEAHQASTQALRLVAQIASAADVTARSPPRRARRTERSFLQEHRRGGQRLPRLPRRLSSTA